MESQARLILASGSPYRREQLARLRVPFTVEAAQIEEMPGAQEVPEETAGRLAREKAAAVAERHAAGLVIGSDQVAALDGLILGKPGTPARAREQLSRCSGRTVSFLTAVCVIDAASGTRQEALEPVSVRFRELDPETIGRYVEADEPLDCAAALRSEGLGAALLESVESRDPSALIGLPLIALCRMLRELGHPLP